MTKSSIFARIRLTIVIIGLTVLAGISKLTHTRVVIEPILHQKNESCISSNWLSIIHQSVVFMLSYNAECLILARVGVTVVDVQGGVNLTVSSRVFRVTDTAVAGHSIL